MRTYSELPARVRLFDCLTALQVMQMHIHATQMNMLPVNPYAAAAENALAAQQAANRRKKLKITAADLQDAPSPGQVVRSGTATGPTRRPPQSAACDRGDFEAGAGVKLSGRR